ncbi:MAG: extracellular solute-binding protein, partial [Sulfobacillus sp.]
MFAKKKTKFGATLLALTALLAVDGAASLPSAAAMQKSSKAPVQVSFWYGLGGQLGNDVQLLVKQFNATHPGIHVTATYQGSYSGGGPEQQKLLAAIRAGDAPDVAQMEVHSMPVFAAAGRLLPLTHLMMASKADKPGDFLTGMLVSTQYKGVYYGVPFNRSVPVLYYNKTLFAKAHIAAPPATWAQLMVDAKKLTK